MTGQGDVTDQAEDGAEDGDAALAQVVVDEVVGEGGDEVAYEGGEEDERQHRVGDVVVGLDVGDEGTDSAIVHAHEDEGPVGCEEAVEVDARRVPALHLG